MKVWIAAALAWLCAAPGALAQDDGFIAHPHLSNIYIDLDTQDGHASRVMFGELCGLNAVRSIVQAPRLGEHPHWQPVANLMLVSETGAVVALRFAAPLEGGPLRVFVLEAGGGDVRETDFEQTLDVGAEVSIAADWTPQGDVRLRVGDEVRSVRMDGAPVALSIANSTGEVIFNGLSIGRTPAGVVACPAG